jgi:hypothetical protein
MPKRNCNNLLITFFKQWNGEGKDVEDHPLRFVLGENDHTLAARIKELAHLTESQNVFILDFQGNKLAVLDLTPEDLTMDKGTSALKSFVDGSLAMKAFR